MSDEMPVVMIPPSGPIQQLEPPAVPHHTADRLTEPTPEQVRAVEAVFAQQDKESATVANMLGIYTSAVLLHNLAVDTFTREAGEIKRKPRLKTEDEEE
jgi:hypothetical protein